MAWKINYSDPAVNAMKRLDRRTAQRIADYMRDRVAAAGNPRRLGKALTGILSGLWRFRVGDYRVICDIQDDTISILVLKIGHRGEVYRRK